MRRPHRRARKRLDRARYSFMFCPDVGNMNDLFGSGEAGERDVWMSVVNCDGPASRLGISRRCAVQRRGAKLFSVVKEQIAGLGIA